MLRLRFRLRLRLRLRFRLMLRFSLSFRLRRIFRLKLRLMFRLRLRFITVMPPAAGTLAYQGKDEQVQKAASEKGGPGDTAGSRGFRLS